jgi:hypothetical protein
MSPVLLLHLPLVTQSGRPPVLLVGVGPVSDQPPRSSWCHGVRLHPDDQEEPLPSPLLPPGVGADEPGPHLVVVPGEATDSAASILTMNLVLLLHPPLDDSWYDPSLFQKMEPMNPLFHP